MKATCNITNDKLSAWSDTRLSPEDYERMCQARFAFWHGSKRFVAKWSPQAEDILQDFGFTIEEDDTYITFRKSASPSDETITKDNGPMVFGYTKPSFKMQPNLSSIRRIGLAQMLVCSSTYLLVYLLAYLLA
jgi:hypothetical protein